MKILAKLLLMFLFLFSAPAMAEIERTAMPCEEGLCLFWWPALPFVEGWHQDINHSRLYNINAQAPDGHTFADAETVIYARAIYKERIPETKSLEMLISNDKEDYLSKDPELMISEVAPQTTGSGQVLKSLTFFPKEKGNWEQVAYGEEGDFYLAFVISSRTKKAFDQAIESYKQFIRLYK